MSESDVEALCHHGRSLLKKHDFAGAREQFSRAAAADPDCCEAHEGLAMASYMAGDLPAAIAEYTRLTLLQPMESRYYTNLGAIHNRMGEHQKACDFLRKAIQRNKKCAESYYNLGIAQRKLKQNSMAVSAYKEAIRLDPTLVEAYQNLGNVFVDMGNLQMAIINFKKALELKPDFDKAKAGLERAEEQQAAAKARNSGLGRVAAIESTMSKVTDVANRDLRDDERHEDRLCVKQLSDEIERLARGCSEHLRLHLTPAILELERAMAHGADDAAALHEAAESFRKATIEWGALRRTLRRKISELADHEKFITAPSESSHPIDEEAT